MKGSYQHEPDCSELIHLVVFFLPKWPIFVTHEQLIYPALIYFLCLGWKHLVKQHIGYLRLRLTSSTLMGPSRHFSVVLSAYHNFTCLFNWVFAGWDFLLLLQIIFLMKENIAQAKPTCHSIEAVLLWQKRWDRWKLSLATWCCWPKMSRLWPMAWLMVCNTEACGPGTREQQQGLYSSPFC